MHLHKRSFRTGIGQIWAFLPMQTCIGRLDLDLPPKHYHTENYWKNQILFLKRTWVFSSTVSRYNIFLSSLTYNQMQIRVSPKGYIKYNQNFQANLILNWMLYIATYDSLHDFVNTLSFKNNNIGLLNCNIKFSIIRLSIAFQLVYS